VILNLTSQLANVPGLTPNEMAVGGGLDNAFNNKGGLPAFGSLYALSPAGVAVALNQLSGQPLASEQTVLTNQALYSRETVLARLRQAGYATSGGTQAVLAYAGPDAITLDDATDPGEPLAFAGSKKSATTSAFPLKAPPAAAPYAPNSGVTFWAQGMGGWGKVNGNSNAAGTTGNFAGVLSGADVRLANNWLVGFALGYTGSSSNVSALASSAQVDTGLVAGYAGTNFGALNLRLGGTYGINSVYTTRQIAFPGFMDRDTARFNAGTGQVFGEVGYGTAISSVAVEPFAGLA
jgi:subtilase-type serine protease